MPFFVKPYASPRLKTTGILINFVARRYEFHCPSLWIPLPVVFYNHGQQNIQRRATFFTSMAFIFSDFVITRKSSSKYDDRGLKSLRVLVVKTEQTVTAKTAMLLQFWRGKVIALFLNYLLSMQISMRYLQLYPRSHPLQRHYYRAFHTSLLRAAGLFSLATVWKNELCLLDVEAFLSSFVEWKPAGL